jgi:phenylalanyl-tRNA synthetase beta chain
VVVEMPAAEPRRLLGVDLGPDEVSSLLGRLGFGVSGEDPLSVVVPTYRPDVTRPADLVEEVARIYGYDRIPATIPHGPGRGLSVSERRRRRICSVMVGAGYHEIISFPFIGSAEMGRLGLDAGDRRAAPVAMRNPLSEDQKWLRTTLIPGLLDAVRVNQARNRPSVALFETGLVFFPGDGEVPDQPQRLAFVAAGRRPAPAWAAEPGERDATDAVGTGEMLAREVGADWSVEQGEDPVFHPGRCGVVSMDGQPVGVVGEIHPATAARFGVAGRVAAGEFDLDALLESAEPSGFVAPSPFPPVVFDLAFELDEGVPAGSLLAAIREAGGRSVEEVGLFDIFTGPPLPPGTKSLAVRLTVRHAERTLTDDDVVPLRQAIAAEVEKRLGGRLRGDS